MTKKYLTLAVLLFIGVIVSAQNFDIINDLIESESKAYFYSSRASEENGEILDRSYFDVVYQNLEITVDPAVYYIEGESLMSFKVVKAGFSEIQIDLSSDLQIDSVFSPNMLSYTHDNNRLEVKYSGALSMGQNNSIFIKYQGKPAAGRSFTQDTTTSGNPVIWTLSEPYGAKDWWPCKQDLEDKIDSISITINCPLNYRAVANGLKLEERVIGNKRSFTFRHNYPITAYLVAIAVADYDVFNEKIPYRDTILNFVNYVFPESKNEAVDQLQDFDKTLFLFDSLFGEYPFSNELYGHAQFTWGGGMEHQTMSFMGDFNHGLVAHELAHQWFGDKVTCGSWQHLWLNEGFATYATALSYEFLFNDNSWLNWKQNAMKTILENTDGSVFIEDTTDVGRMFDGALTYYKGAYLLHMLRWKMGDDAFFKSVKDYLNDAELAYGYSLTDNFKYHLKQNGGEGIDEFFDDWFYSKGWPSYNIKWYQDVSNVLYIVASQEQSYIWEGTFFDMDLPIKIFGTSNSELLKLPNSYSNQEYKIELDYKVVDLSFNQEMQVLSGNNVVEAVDYQHELIGYSIYPNPAKDVVVVHASDPNLPNTAIELYDLQGGLVWSGIAQQGLSSEGFSVDLSGFDNGVYFISVKDFYNTTLLKFVKL